MAAVQPNTLAERFPRGNRVLRQIGQNTIPICLFYVGVFEPFYKGFLGFPIRLATMTPALEIPLITALTLLICLGVIYPLKKMPFVKRLIG